MVDPEQAGARSEWVWWPHESDRLHRDEARAALTSG
jgi:hypothetical protein